MKSSIRHLSALLVLTCMIPAAALGDEFEDGMRAAFASYKKGDTAAVTAKLRELFAVVEAKEAAKFGELLPETVGAWKGDAASTGEMAGGGTAVTRIYKSGEKTITVIISKDSPLIGQLLPLLANPDLIEMTHRKTHKIAGETAIMEGEHKLQIVLKSRIYVEIGGDDTTGEKELVDFAGQAGLEKLAQAK